MIGILRECARVFSSYRRWHAGLIGPSVRRAQGRNDLADEVEEPGGKIGRAHV